MRSESQRNWHSKSFSCIQWITSIAMSCPKNTIWQFETIHSMHANNNEWKFDDRHNSLIYDFAMDQFLPNTNRHHPIPLMKFESMKSHSRFRFFQFERFAMYKMHNNFARRNASKEIFIINENGEITETTRILFFIRNHINENDIIEIPEMAMNICGVDYGVINKFRV